MRSLLALLAVALLSACAAACGGSGKSAGSASRTSTGAAVTGSAGAGSASGATPALPHAKGDEDDDDEGVNELSNPNIKFDSDNDKDNDYKNDKSKGYYDSDDGVVRTYGHPASEADNRALTALLERYYAAAAAGDGAKACSMITSTFVQAIPEDYGQAPGPAYLRGKTCRTVMSRLFKHEHAQLRAPVEIAGVRVSGNQARALLGSRTRPASFIILKRERGAWKINGLLGSPLP